MNVTSCEVEPLLLDCQEPEVFGVQLSGACIFKRYIQTGSKGAGAAADFFFYVV